jgi:hypothetical protein
LEQIRAKFFVIFQHARGEAFKLQGGNAKIMHCGINVFFNNPGTRHQTILLTKPPLYLLRKASKKRGANY